MCPSWGHAHAMGGDHAVCELLLGTDAVEVVVKSDLGPRGLDRRPTGNSIAGPAPPMAETSAGSSFLPSKAATTHVKGGWRQRSRARSRWLVGAGLASTAVAAGLASEVPAPAQAEPSRAVGPPARREESPRWQRQH